MFLNLYSGSLKSPQTERLLEYFKVSIRLPILLFEDCWNETRDFYERFHKSFNKKKKKKENKINTPLPVPFQSLLVEAIEEVRLSAHGSHVWMDAQKLQESPSATFLHPDDDGLREFFVAKIIGYRNIVGRGITVRQVRQLFADKRDRRRIIRAELLRFLSIFKDNFGLEITSLVIHGSGQGFAVTVEAVKEVNEENNHGKEDRQLGVHLQVSKVERSSPFTTSHGSQS